MMFSQLDIPTGGIAQGSLFGFDRNPSSTLTLGNSWKKIRGNFALSASGDNVVVYCIKNDASNLFLFAALYRTDWSPANSDPSVFSTNESARPVQLPDNCALSLIGEKKNWWYEGTRKGGKMELLNSISDPSNWSADNTSFAPKTNPELR